MQPQSYVFIGRAGSGKGTQARLLIDAIKAKDPDAKILDIETGAEFRRFIEGTSHTAKLGKVVVDSGRLMPEFMPIYLWVKKLVENYTGREYLIFDGTPRKLMEAEIFESAFPFYSLPKPWVIFLDIDHDHSSDRLIKRAGIESREDDHKAAIERRRVAFEREVMPAVEYYRTSPNVKFLDIDGRRSIEDVRVDIAKRVGL